MRFISDIIPRFWPPRSFASLLLPGRPPPGSRDGSWGMAPDALAAGCSRGSSRFTMGAEAPKAASSSPSRSPPSSFSSVWECCCPASISLAMASALRRTSGSIFLTSSCVVYCSIAKSPESLPVIRFATSNWSKRSMSLALPRPPAVSGTELSVHGTSSRCSIWPLPFVISLSVANFWEGSSGSASGGMSMPVTCSQSLPEMMRLGITAVSAEGSSVTLRACFSVMDWSPLTSQLWNLPSYTVSPRSLTVRVRLTRPSRQ
mmetsp:Transcript_35267/g.94491  ORF Transcript_35267/g.94491 Transcript_35267/m.94491 type:complete len:260 (-) Transcript_35267:238-1017(-)